jgi:hypothetical protein
MTPRKASTVNPSAERLVRATARGIRALGVALFAAVVAFAVAIAPIGPAGASDLGWHPLLAADIAGDPAAAEHRDGHSAPGGDRDDGDDLLAARTGTPGGVAARFAAPSSGRRRGIRSVPGAEPRGPPAA